jgi:hypothetical protein
MQATVERTVVDGGGCELSPGAYESQGYIVRQVEVRGAFDLFQLVPSTAARAMGVDLPVEGEPFRVDRAVAAAKALELRLHAPAQRSESPFGVTVVVSYLKNCSDQGGRKLIDVRYHAFTTYLPEAKGPTIESREAQRTDPAAASGTLTPTRRLKLAPAAAYNASDGFQAGGTVSVRNVADRIDTVDAEAIASNRSHVLRLAMTGSSAPHLKWLDAGDWRVSIADQDEAGSPGDQFSTTSFKGQFAAQTKPFGGAGTLFRFGGSLEGGNQEANVASNGTSIDDRTGYGALRAAAGLTTGGNRYSASASYGVLLGHVPGDSLVSYSKQIADVAWESQFPIANHIALQLEARLNAGWLLGASAAPVAEFFRGGNREESFLEGESWIIRSNPFLRSVPSNQLDRTSPTTSLGGDRFVAMNVTLSAPVWRYPLIPLWLSQSQDFKSGIAAARETANSQAAVYYQSKDPAQQLMAADAAKVTTALNNLFDGLTAAQGSIDADHKDAMDDCLEAADEARDKMTHLKDTGFGPIATSVVPGVASSCVAELAAALPPATLTARLDELNALAASIAEKQKLVRTDLAQAKADDDLKFAFTAIDTFINDINAVSVGPVLSFDAARIGPQDAAQAGGTRYGIGLGIRVSIVNVLHLTALYAWNPSPLPWESRGAWMMTLSISDLMR